MKKRLLLSLLSVLLCTNYMMAQEDNSFYGFDNSFENLSNPDSISLFTGAFAFARIGGENYAGARFQPELNLGKVGVGFDIPVYFNLETGDFYSDEFKNGSGVLRLISYVRYGRKKKDPVFLKVGQLRGESLGYGSLLNNYNNSPSFEKRKVGLSYDIRIKKVVGIEGLYSDFNLESFNLFAIRPYVRPFGASGIPVLKTLDFGFSYITDKDETNRFGDESGKNEFLSDGMKAYGFDMGITFINSGFINLTGYTHFSKLAKVKSDSLARYQQAIPPSQGYGAGKGMGIGVNANMNIVGNFFRLNSRIERLWYTDNYLPQFFDAHYEINKDTKIAALGDAKNKQGIYGSLTASLMDKVLVGGNLLLPDNVSEETPATMQLNLRTKDLFDKIIIEGYYTKANLVDFGNAFDFDENSLALLRFAYKISPIIATGIDYKWTWNKQDDGTYKADNSVMPYIALRFQF
ncbi:hypothetical protein [Marinifilum caeruleilacunae]|uniref:Uncharacterized protein n=1 Tax=Marinifilum caeruleilacunae TaxID=2499076 RepID=A0ABX1WTT0_9BACT|nr:hypothetical protein [Marinifilum caeruleilacunae]NOU59422.1 hypothetical protein [Marinifilum caeruleilacunae]